MPETSPRKDFLTSPHHATLGLAALACLASAEPLAAIIGGVVYVLGWVYLPDMPLFTRWREKKIAAALEASRQAELGDFAMQRDAMLSQLLGRRPMRHTAFVKTCQQVAMGQDPRARKVEEMQWTYLRLLTIEQSLEVFLEGERRDGVPLLLREATEEVEALEHEIAELKSQNTPTLSAKERLLESRKSRLDVLRQRAERITEAQANQELASAELDRLDEQIKLIRADTVAAKNAGNISSRIDSTFEHLAQTNRWLSDMDRFRDQLGEVPEGGMGVRSPLAAQPQMPAKTKVAE
jgi:DNA repair exonuclease SbcCD ATPase subunit